jgi:hypothetical protein
MREQTITAVRYSPKLRREVTVRLTYAVSEGPRPEVTRWFLIREEVQNLRDSQGRPTQPPDARDAGDLPWSFSSAL